MLWELEGDDLKFLNLIFIVIISIGNVSWIYMCIVWVKVNVVLKINFGKFLGLCDGICLIIVGLYCWEGLF